MPFEVRSSRSTHKSVSGRGDASEQNSQANWVRTAMTSQSHRMIYSLELLVLVFVRVTGIQQLRIAVRLGATDKNRNDVYCRVTFPGTVQRTRQQLDCRRRAVGRKETRVDLQRTNGVEKEKHCGRARHKRFTDQPRL